MFKKISIMILTIGIILIGKNSLLAQWWGEDSSDSGEYLGEYSSNPLDPDSTSNTLGQYGNELLPNSINNPLGQYGSKISPRSVNNPLATDTPKLYSQDGEYLGKVSSNPLDPESISNPLGKYGSPLSPNSVNNPIGRYGSSISPESVNNPLATNAPVIYYGTDDE